MSEEWLIKGASIVGGEPTDIHLKDGVIAAVGRGLAAGRATVLDAGGLVALPGLVDLHTHLREPGREDAETVETGTRAAALGGYTAVHAMANTEPVADTAGVVEQVWRLGEQAGYVDVRPVGAVTVGLHGKQLAELGAMADSAARVRVFSDDGFCVADPLLMRRALEYVKAFNGVIAQHAQEPRLTEGAQLNEGEVASRLGLAGWPAAAEEAIIARDCLLAAHVGAALHVCHVSTAGSVEIIRWAKSKGWRVTAEVTPHHLLLTDDLAGDYDTLFKVNPPLRTQADVDALRQGLADGTIDCVATDHAPHPVEAKECRVGGRRQRHDRPGDGAAGRPARHGGHRAARLGGRRGPDVRPAGGDRPGRRPRRLDRARRAREPDAVRRGRARGAGRPAGARLQEPQQPVRGHGAAGRRARDVPARHARRSLTER